MGLEAIITMRDNHAMVAENHSGQHPFGQLNILQRNPCQRGFALDFRFKEPDFPVRKVFHVQCCRGHENPVDFVGSDKLGIEHHINIKIFLEIILGLRHELHITDAGNGMLDAMFLGQYTGHHVHFVTGRHRNENIRIPHIRVVHGNGAGAIGRNRQHIQRILGRLQLAFVLVDNHHIKLFLGQKLGNAVPQLPGPHNNNTQIIPSPLTVNLSYIFQFIITPFFNLCR